MNQTGAWKWKGQISSIGGHNESCHNNSSLWKSGFSLIIRRSHDCGGLYWRKRDQYWIGGQTTPLPCNKGITQYKRSWDTQLEKWMPSGKSEENFSQALNWKIWSFAMEWELILGYFSGGGTSFWDNLMLLGTAIFATENGFSRKWKHPYLECRKTSPSQSWRVEQKLDCPACLECQMTPSDPLEERVGSRQALIWAG